MKPLLTLCCALFLAGSLPACASQSPRTSADGATKTAAKQKKDLPTTWRFNASTVASGMAFCDRCHIRVEGSGALHGHHICGDPDKPEAVTTWSFDASTAAPCKAACDQCGIRIEGTGSLSGFHVCGKAAKSPLSRTKK